MNNREDEKQAQATPEDTATNQEEEQRKQYLIDLQKRVKESRKQPDCFNCCFAYWLFILLGFVFRQFFIKKIDETPESCDFISLIMNLLLILFSLFTCCRCIDGCCIILPCTNTKCFHLSLQFHELNNIINYHTCKWGLIILTVIWVLNYSCIVFWPLFTFLLIAWIVILLWKSMENE